MHFNGIPFGDRPLNKTLSSEDGASVCCLCTAHHTHPLLFGEKLEGELLRKGGPSEQIGFESVGQIRQPTTGPYSRQHRHQGTVIFD